MPEPKTEKKVVEPPQKEVIAPPPPMNKPMHSHAGFIIAIVVTVVLLLAAAVLAYLSWDKAGKVARENDALTESVEELEDANADLVVELDEALQLAEPTPFFYTTLRESEEGLVTTLYRGSVNGAEEVFSTTGDQEHVGYSVYANPRVGYDGRIWLHRVASGDDPGLTLFEFDVETDTTLEQAGFADAMPLRQSAAISPDETLIAAVYGEGHSVRPDLANKAVVWNVLTGEMTEVVTLGPGEYFAGTPDPEYPVAVPSNVYWQDNECFYAQVFVDSEDGPRVLRAAPYQQYCPEL